jgi:predicted DNA-binding protein
MADKPLKPSQIATKTKRKTYSFSLAKENTEALMELAKQHEVPVSYLIDEAIAAYLHTIKENQNGK